MTAGTVWLASYPKSGNTWLRAVFSAWVTGGPVDLNDLVDGPIASSREHFDFGLGVPSSSMTPAEVEILRPRVDELIAAEADAPLLRKIHDGYMAGPEGEPIVSVAATRAAVYMIRDPREVAVSYAHHVGRPDGWAAEHMSDPDAAMSADEDRLRHQLRQRLGTWSQHVRSWVDEAPFPVEVVRYEDCAAEPVATFARALRCAGFDQVDDAGVAPAVEHAAFDRLRQAERDHGFAEQPPGADNFFRRGESGSWREELAADLAARIQADHGEVMERFGYD
jgi:aryl sulfotransferase